MNDQFDELAKGLAQSVTRRGALKKFGFGLAVMALASLGLAKTAQAKPPCFKCNCHKPDYGCADVPDSCYSECILTCPAQCQPY
jgi:hypothetical protein